MLIQARSKVLRLRGGNDIFKGARYLLLLYVRKISFLTTAKFWGHYPENAPHDYGSVVKSSVRCYAKSRNFNSRLELTCRNSKANYTAPFEKISN